MTKPTFYGTVSAEGYVRQGGQCVLTTPVCDSTELSCTRGNAEDSADTLNPATNRWTCTAAGRTASCQDPAPPPTCGTNETYGLDSSNELICVCVAGYVRHNGQCEHLPDCGSTDGKL